MAYAISAQTSVNFVGSTYSYSTIKFLVDSLDIFVLPLVNPDGRDYVMAAESQRWWRKNRSALPVDLNRNYDFLFDSGIGTSADPGSDVYRGPYAFSEPETRKHPLDQTTDPAQNFRVPNPDRGIPNDGRYREYIPAEDLNWFVQASNRMREATSKVRGRAYTVQQSVGLYPTTATVDDYAFSRHLVNPALTKVRLIAIETGGEPAGSGTGDHGTAAACRLGGQPDGGQQGGVIAEVTVSGGVVIGAGSDLSGFAAEEAVVQALAAEAEIDPAVVAARGVEFAGRRRGDRARAGRCGRRRHPGTSRHDPMIYSKALRHATHCYGPLSAMRRGQRASAGFGRALG